MSCPRHARVALFVVYIASIVSALANPADLNYEDAYLLTQGANIVTLLLLSYCKRKAGDAFLASLLGVAFTLRATGSWRGGSRWDSLLVMVGMLVILQDAWYQVVPKAVTHRTLLYFGFSCLIMPVLSALPHLLIKPRVDPEVLREAMRLASEAYSIPKNVAQPLLGATWTLHAAETDTSAGVTRVLNAKGEADIYVYFKGSESTINWKSNLNILNEDVPADWGCSSGSVLRMHQGYARAFGSVAAKMLVALENELATVTGSPRIVFCGHSLGGALATVAALCVACKLPRLRPNIVVVTFGAPQVGDGNFVKHFNSVVPASLRVVNPMDPVPRLLSAQLVHVKGYYPVSSFSLVSTVNAHAPSTYEAAVAKPRPVAILASFAPAAVAAVLIGAYVMWQLKRHR